MQAKKLHNPNGGTRAVLPSRIEAVPLSPRGGAKRQGEDVLLAVAQQLRFTPSRAVDVSIDEPTPRPLASLPRPVGITVDRMADDVPRPSTLSASPSPRAASMPSDAPVAASSASRSVSFSQEKANAATHPVAAPAKQKQSKKKKQAAAPTEQQVPPAAAPPVAKPRFEVLLAPPVLPRGERTIEERATAAMTSIVPPLAAVLPTREEPPAAPATARRSNSPKITQRFPLRLRSVSPPTTPVVATGAAAVVPRRAATPVQASSKVTSAARPAAAAMASAVPSASNNVAAPVMASLSFSVPHQIQAAVFPLATADPTAISSRGRRPLTSRASTSPAAGLAAVEKKLALLHTALVGDALVAKAIDLPNAHHVLMDMDRLVREGIAAASLSSSPMQFSASSSSIIPSHAASPKQQLQQDANTKPTTTTTTDTISPRGYRAPPAFIPAEPQPPKDKENTTPPSAAKRKTRPQQPNTNTSPQALSPSTGITGKQQQKVHVKAPTVPTTWDNDNQSSPILGAARNIRPLEADVRAIVDMLDQHQHSSHSPDCMNMYTTYVDPTMMQMVVNASPVFAVKGTQTAGDAKPTAATPAEQAKYRQAWQALVAKCHGHLSHRELELLSAPTVLRLAASLKLDARDTCRIELYMKHDAHWAKDVLRAQQLLEGPAGYPSLIRAISAELL